MNNKKYQLAGWLSLVSAVVVVPTIAVGVFLDYLSRSYPFVNILQILLSILFCSLGVYILFLFKNLLNVRYQFHLIDKLILALIWINVIITILGFVKYFVPEISAARLALGIIVMVLFYSVGILNIVFGVKLLKLKDDLFGLLKPFAYTTIISGVCIVSILLMPFGLLAAVAAYVIQGIIFLRVAEDVEFV